MDLKAELPGIKADTVYGYTCAKLSFYYFNIIRSRLVRLNLYRKHEFLYRWSVEFKFLKMRQICKESLSSQGKDSGNKLKILAGKKKKVYGKN